MGMHGYTYLRTHVHKNIAASNLKTGVLCMVTYVTS